jgi:hypothetical protein
MLRADFTMLLSMRSEKAAMRFTVLLITMCLPFALMPAFAQTPVVSPPWAISSDDLREYCLFNDKLYSVGAFICAAKGIGLTCDRGETAGRPAWKLTASPECESNQSVTPQ